MLRAGLSNAIYRMVEHGNVLPMRGFDRELDSECEVDNVVCFFMDELAKPAPQVERFIRQNQLRKYICDYEERSRMEILRDHYGRWISVRLAQRIFEQEVYDFSRSIGLSKEQATGHVIKARESSSRCDIDLPELGDYESSECEDILNYLYSYPEPEGLPFVKEPKGLMYVSENETRKIEQLLAESNSKGAKQVKRYLQTLKDNGSSFEYEMIILRLQFLGGEPLVDNISGLRENIASMEAADKTREKKAARKDVKKAHTIELRAQKEARRHLEKKKSRDSNDHQASRPDEQGFLTSNPSHPPNVQSLEVQGKPLKRTKKGNKRKSELALPIQSEILSEDHHKHKKGRVDRDVQDTNSKKVKKKKAVGPQQSPFFQRSSGPKAKKKDDGRILEQLMGFQPPMIQ